jgi:uncharacterized repeat protein (TIGR01451 family)
MGYRAIRRAWGMVVNPDRQGGIGAQGRRSSVSVWFCLGWLVLAGTPWLAGEQAAASTDPSRNAPQGILPTDLQVNITDAPDPVQIGQEVEYSINVTNLGPNPATAVTADLFFSSALTPVPQATPGWSCSVGGLLSCTLISPTLAIGSAPVLQLRFTAPPLPQFVQFSATVTSVGGDPVPANNSNIVQSTQVVNPTADLQLGLTPSTASATVGSPISFTANVINAGPGDAPSLQVNGTLGGSISFSSFTVPASWSCLHSGGSINCNYVGGNPPGTLPPGVNAAAIVINGIAGPGAGTASVNLTATSSATDPTPANASSSITVTAPPPIPVDLSLSKTVIGAQPIARNVPFVYRLVVANAGNSGQSASAIQITDPLPAGIALQSFSGTGWTCNGAVNCSYGPSLAIGQVSAPLDLQVVYNASVPVSGTLVSNTASVAAAEPDPVPGNNQSTAVASIRGSADLAVQLVGASTAVAGSSFNIDLVANNAGPDTAANVTAAMVIAAGFNIGVVSGGAGWSCLATGQSVSCQRAALVTGSSTAASITVTAPAASGGPFNQLASISSDSFDPSAGNNSATLPISVTAAVTTLTLSKSDTVDPVGVNAQFEYVLTVTNTGNISQSGLNIVDSMPAGLTYLSFVGTGWACALSPAPNVSCSNPGPLAAGASSSVRLRVRADTLGALTNSAQVSSAQNPAGASATEGTTVVDLVSLTLNKRARSSSVTLGSNAIFDLTVSNTGQSEATGLVLLDDLPAGLDPVSASGDGWNCTIDAARVDCRRPVLLRSSSSVVVIEAHPRNTGSFLNRAQVVAGSNSPVLASDSITVTSAVPGAGADLAIDLSDSVDPAGQGEEFIYAIRVRNLGPGAASGVRVINSLSAGLESLGSNSAGWTCQLGTPSECTLAGSVASGGESLLNLRVRAAAVGTAFNSASVTANEPDPISANNTASESTQIVAVTTRSADLQLSASGPASVPAGETVELLAQIRNLGPTAASNVLLRTQSTGAWSLQSGSGSGFSCIAVASAVECRVTTIAATEVVEVRLLGRANDDASGSLEALLDVSSATLDPNPGNNGSRVAIAVVSAPPPPPTSADLSITKLASADPVAFGERFSYSLTVRNNGPGQAEGVVISDLLPAGLTLVSVSGAGLACAGTSAIECRASAALAAGQQLVATVTVEAPSERGSIVNEASVQSGTQDPTAGNNRSSATVVVSSPEGSEAEDILDALVIGDTIAGDAVSPVVALCDGASGEVSALCDAIYRDAANGNSDQVDAALRSLYPEEVLAQYASLNQLSTSQYFNVDARLTELRSGGGNGANLSGLNFINGSQAIPIGLLQSLFQSDDEPQIGGPGELISPWGFFVNGTISRGDQNINSSGREVVQDFDSIGVTAGVDYRRSVRWVLGGAIGFDKFSSGLTDAGKLETRAYTLTGYSAYYISDQSYVDSRLSYGRVSLDQTRRLRANLTGFTLDETITGDTKASQFTVATGFGHHISRGAWTFTPNAFIRYMRSSVDAFDEQGSSFAVRYGDQTVSSLVFGAGVQVNRVISLSNGVLTPQFDLIWNQESSNDNTVIDASYVGGDPGEFFRLRPESPDKSYGSVGFGLVYIMANGKQAYFQWRESLGVDGLSRSTLNLGARFEF